MERDSLLDYGKLEWQQTLHDPKVLLMRMFLENLTQFGVSKVSLLLVAP